MAKSKNTNDITFYEFKQLSEKLKTEREDCKWKLKDEEKKLKAFQKSNDTSNLNFELCRNMVKGYTKRIEDLDIMLLLLKERMEKWMEDRQRGK